MRLAIFLVLALVAFTVHAQEDNYVCKEHLLLHATQSDLNMGARTSPYTSNYDLKYNRLEWEIDPNQYYIKGVITTYFVPTEASMASIFFDLSSNLQVNSVSYHGVNIGFSQQNDLLEITFPQALTGGLLDSVAVDYEGTPPSTGFGSFGQAFHNNSPAIWTLSEPYGGRDWWPCKVDLGDKLDSIDVYIATPQGYRAASNGVLESETASGDKIVYHWKHRFPITGYLVALAVTDYAQYSDFVPVPGGDPIEVLNYVYPENLGQAQAATISTVQAMQLYNELYGLYPFASEKYGHAQFSWGGGMEHQTMSFVGGWSHSLQAHELAHQWFGDKVTCGSWQDIWLNEGFATYSEGMNYEHGIGPNTWQNWLTTKRNQVTGQPDGSVWVPDTTSVNRIFSSRLTYSKGALVLHMLRWKVGSDNFFQAIRNYNSAPGIAYNYARTSDLQAHMEAQSGLDLNEFFEDWFYGQGYPSYQIQWGYNAQQQLRVQINQTTSNASVDFFEMPVPIQFFGQGQDTILVFDHTFSGQAFNVNLPFTVQQVIFDPELWILSANNSLAVGVNDMDQASKTLYLYPNPASNQLRFDWSETGIMPQAIQVSDVSGKVMIKTTEVPENQVIDIEALPSGYYFLQITTNRGMAVRSFVKQ